MKFHDADEVRKAANGRWIEILAHFNVETALLRNIHGPCPGCGGKDRFRFDDQEGNGTFICSQGSGENLAGDGVGLLGHIKDWDWKRCIQEIGDLLQCEKKQLDFKDSPRELKPLPPAPAVFENDKLKAFAARWRDVVTTAWLADRSPIDPTNLAPADFLSSIYLAGENVVVFTNQNSQGQALWPAEEIPTSGREGVWFLAQPVDGKIYPNPRSIDKKTGKPKLSRRSEESVGAKWRFLVVESDQANARDWIAALVQLPLAITAVYTSAKRSIHALVRVDAESIDEWRDFSAAIKPILVTLGADRGVVGTAVRLSRLPGCFREGWTDKESGEYHRFPRPQLQKLLYLNPSPTAPRPICAFPKLRDVIERWSTAAVKFLPWDAGEIISRSKPRDLNDCIAALEKAENLELTESLNDVLGALNWFSTSEKARDLLEKLRAKK